MLKVKIILLTQNEHLHFIDICSSKFTIVSWATITTITNNMNHKQFNPLWWTLTFTSFGEGRGEVVSF